MHMCMHMCMCMCMHMYMYHTTSDRVGLDLDIASFRFNYPACINRCKPGGCFFLLGRT
jgi:hypothetical protein